jgi:excisionase family DNA binding protein
MMTISEAAARLHVDASTLRRWNNLGIIPAYRISPRGDRRFKDSDIHEYVRVNYAANRKLLGLC